MTLQYKRIAGVEEKLQGHQFGLDIAFADDLLVNESEMSLWVPFASGVRRDGVGDLLEIGGIDTSRHIKNPVVLFDHGKAVQLPVGMSEDPDTKQYRVVLDPVAKVAKGKAYFYQGSKDMEGVGAGQVYEHALFCEQLFDLVVKRFIRAGSIGYQVKTARRLPADFNTGTPEGLHLISVLMLEFSVVVMPANADTVGKVLSLDKICGKKLSPYLVKSLAPYAPPRKAMMGYERKARTPNRYEGDPSTLPGEGYNNSRNIGIGDSQGRRNLNSVAGAESEEILRNHTRQIDQNTLSDRLDKIQRQHHGMETPKELEEAAAHNEWLSQQHLYPHPLRDIPGDERVRRAQKKRLPKQGQKANKKPTYRDVGAVPRVGYYGPADEQADLDQPFDNQAGLYSRSTYLPSSPDDPNTLAGHFAHAQEDGHDHMMARSESNDLVTGYRDDIDIGERGPYVPRPHPRDIKRKSIDKLSGGLADDKQPRDFDPVQLKAGIKVEMEHTDDPRLAREIAMDHLSEDPAYYQKLSRMEGKSVKAWVNDTGEIASQGPDYEKHGNDAYNTPLHMRMTSRHLAGEGPDAVRPSMTGEAHEQQQRASQIMNEIINRDLGREVERTHLRERQEAQDNKQLPRQGRKANLDPRQRQFVDQLSQYTGQEIPNEEYHEVPPQNANLTPRQQIFMDNLERMQLGTPRRSVKALRKLYGSKAVPGGYPDRNKIRDAILNRTPEGAADPTRHHREVDSISNTRPSDDDAGRRARDFVINESYREHQEALDRKSKGIKSQPSDDIPKEKARQILKDGEVHGHPLTEKQRRMFGAAASKSDETPVRNPPPLTENSQRERLDNLAYRSNEYFRNINQPDLYQPVSSGVHTPLKTPHYSAKAADNDHDTPKTDLQRRIMETEAMRATGSPLVEEGRVDPREHRRMMINPSIRKPVSGVTNEQQVNIGMSPGGTAMYLGGVGIGWHPSMRLEKKLRIKSLRKMYGTKMAKRKDESNEAYADRMNRDELSSAYRQYDQRINDYYNAASAQSPHGYHPEITQHFDGEVRRGTRDLSRAEDARERNYERRLQGGKAYRETEQGGFEPYVNDPKTDAGARAKRSRERYGTHTNYDYRPEREPATEALPDNPGIWDEWTARNFHAHENTPSPEERDNEYQARRERYYEENKALPGERLPVPHGAEIHRNTIPPAHRDFRVISSKSAEGEDDLPDFYKPKEPVYPPAPEQPRRYYREHVNDEPVYGTEHSYFYGPVQHISKVRADTLNENMRNLTVGPRQFREIPESDVDPNDVYHSPSSDEDIENSRERNEASGLLPRRSTPKTKGMKVRNWDEYEQHQERLDNESLQAQRDPNITDEQNTTIQDRVGREYERLHDYSDKINRRQRRIDQRRQQEEKGLDLFSGATHHKIGKYTDQAFHSFETGQISEDQLRDRLARAARVRAEMDKARGQFMRQKDDRLDHYNQQAVAGKSAEGDDLPDFYKPKQPQSLPEATPEQAHQQAYRDIENARRAINREMLDDNISTGFNSRADQRLQRRNILRAAHNARTGGDLPGVYEHLGRLPSKEETLLPPEKSLKSRIKSLRKIYGKSVEKTPEQWQQEAVAAGTASDQPGAIIKRAASRNRELMRQIEAEDKPAIHYKPEYARNRRLMETHGNQPDDKSMDSDQEEVANKPLKDGVLPGLKRNKRSINGDALLYVDEKDIPSVRKKADELGLKIHRITGNTPGYVRMRLQGNDDAIDTVASVFGKLADTKE